MKCPFCGHDDTKVSDSRAMDENTVIRRRRACDECGERFTTYERLDILPLTVIKRNGERESFNSEKILNSILRSCDKRKVTMDQMTKMVREIEIAALNTMRREIETREIGEMVMDKLKNVDEVAYIRFASVYRRFQDIDTFMQELSKMLKEKTE